MNAGRSSGNPQVEAAQPTTTSASAGAPSGSAAAAIAVRAVHLGHADLLRERIHGRRGQ